MDLALGWGSSDWAPETTTRRRGGADGPNHAVPDPCVDFASRSSCQERMTEMKTVTVATLTALTLLIYAPSVQGQIDRCAELLRLSRTTSRTVIDRREFTRNVDNFCDEARRARSQNRSLNLDLRVMGLGQGGGSEASTNAAFTKYCSDTSNERREESNYQQYLDGIDPLAFGAYDACTSAARNGVEFRLLPPTRDELHLIVSFPTTDARGEAHMSWDAIGPVTCQWESFRGGGDVTSQRRVLRANERTRLKCERDSFNSAPINEPDYVNVIRESGDATINIPWVKYGQDDKPVPTLDAIRMDLMEALAAMGGRVRELEERPDTNFGEWERVEVGRVYRAESDGMLSVSSGGTGAGRFRILVGESDDRREMVSRASVRAFFEAVMPVQKGRYYYIQRRGGRSGTIQAYWLAVGR